MCYRKGAFDHFDTIMANGPFQVAEHRATEGLYRLKEKKLVETGYPLLDTLLAAGKADSAQTPPAGSRVSRDRKAPRIMIAPSYQKDCIPDSCLDELISAVTDSNPGCAVVFRPHPQYVHRFPAKMQAIVEKYTDRHDVEMEADFSKPSTMDQADVLITDWSGIAYEYAFKTKHPVVFIDTPMKVINPEWEKINLTPTDISFRNEVGVSVPLSDIPAAGRAVSDMLADPGRFAKKIEELLIKQFFNPGHAGEVAGKYILDSLINRKKGTKK